MAYAAWSVIAGEQPTSSKWNILGTNDASFNDGSGFAWGASAALTGGPAWSTWSPTWANLTVGNGTITAKYQQIGKTVHFRLYLLAGTTTSVSGTVTFTMPVTAVDPGSIRLPMGVMELEDNGVGNYTGFLSMTSTTVISPLILTAGGTYTGWSGWTNAVPYNTFATGDSFQASGSYEAA